MSKILLIDDSRTQLKHIKRMLTDGGHEVIATSSGREAVEHLKSTMVDVVLTDLYMPEPDGFEIVQTARDLPQHPALIVMSSNALACDVFRDASALGAVAALQKPFSAEKLLATIRDAATGNSTILRINDATSSGERVLQSA